MCQRQDVALQVTHEAVMHRLFEGIPHSGWRGALAASLLIGSERRVVHVGAGEGGRELRLQLRRDGIAQHLGLEAAIQMVRLIHDLHPEVLALQAHGAVVHADHHGGRGVTGRLAVAQHAAAEAAGEELLEGLERQLPPGHEDHDAAASEMLRYI